MEVTEEGVNDDRKRTPGIIVSGRPFGNIIAGFEIQSIVPRGKFVG